MPLFYLCHVVSLDITPSNPLISILDGPLHARTHTQERKKLALTLQDAKSVVAKLELVCGVIIHIIFAVIYLMIFQVRCWCSCCIPKGNFSKGTTGGGGGVRPV